MTAQLAQSSTEMLEFVGPPYRLIALGDIPQFKDEPEITGSLAGHLAEGRSALRFLRAGRRTAPRLRLRLDPRTPPGDYEGTLKADKEGWRIVARVLPQVRLSVLAGDLTFTAADGEKAKTTLALVNDGNTEIHLPRNLPIGLFDDDGLEAAFAASYAKPVKGFEELVEVFHAKLRESHSGILKLAIMRGYGTHSPGTSFAAEFALDIAPPLKPGHRYHGVASTDFLDLPISVTVTKRASS